LTTIFSFSGTNIYYINTDIYLFFLAMKRRLKRGYIDENFFGTKEYSKRSQPAKESLRTSVSSHFPHLRKLFFP